MSTSNFTKLPHDDSASDNPDKPSSRAPIISPNEQSSKRYSRVPSEVSESDHKSSRSQSSASSSDSEGDAVAGQIESERNGVLSVHNLSYTVTIGPPFKRKTKVILRNISAVFSNGLNALMGPTGAGKSTLLDLLANRKNQAGVEGRILLDGEQIGSNFNLASGYVTQEDIIMGTLTVRENLMFAANLKMRESTPDQRAECVDEIVHDLALTRCEHTKIGNELFKGVSGGERKRCCIGMELVTKPKILFLDEPTTGLDSTTAMSVVSLLKDLANKGPATVIFSIHQPRYSIYKFFDRVHLLSCFGETIYHGQADQAVSYFAREGFVCDKRENPTDFFLDVIIQNSKFGPNIGTNYKAVLSTFDEEKSQNIANVLDYDETKNLVQAFLQSPKFEEVEAKIKGIEEELHDKNIRRPYYEKLSYATNTWEQFSYLCDRSIKNVTLSPRVVLIPTIASCLLACIFGWMSRDWKFDLVGFQNLYGALFFMVIQPVMGTFPAIDIMLSGQKFFLHETSKGYYSALPYLASKFVSELVLLCGIPAFCFSVLCYLIIRLKREWLAFCIFVGVNELGAFAACCLIFFISAAAGTYEVATAIVPGVLVVMILFSGLFLNLTSLSSVFRALEYVSIPRHMLSLQASFQLTDTLFCGVRSFSDPKTTDQSENASSGNSTAVGSDSYSSLYACETGEYQLELNGIGYDYKSRVESLIFLLLFPIILIPLTYIVLHVKSKRKL